MFVITSHGPSMLIVGGGEMNGRSETGERGDSHVDVSSAIAA